jgi:hypothetical protein
MIFDRSYSFPTKAIDIKLCYGLSISKAFAKPDRYENGSRGCFMGNHGVRLGHVALRSALSTGMTKLSAQSGFFKHRTDHGCASLPRSRQTLREVPGSKFRDICQSACMSVLVMRTLNSRFKRFQSPVA